MTVDENLSMSRFPCFVNVLRTIQIASLEQNLISPLRNVDGVDVSARFNAQACSWTSGGLMFCSLYVNVFAGVELEGRLSTEDVQMQASVWMKQRHLPLQSLRSCIDGDFGLLRIQNEAVVNIRFLWS